MLDLVVLIVVIVVNLLFIAMVMSRNFKKIQNIFYTLMILLLIVWSAVNYSTNHFMAYNSQLVANRFSFAIALLLIAAVWLFSVVFPKRIVKYELQGKIVFLLTIPTMAITAFSPYVVRAVTYIPEREVTDVTSGGFYFIFTLAVLVLLMFIIKNFYVSYRAAKSDTLARQQILYTAAGIIFTFLWILVTTTIWPQLTGNWTVSKLGIAGSLFLGTFVGFAIIRHKLFDIRLIVARALGYVLSLVTVGGLYSLVVFVIFAGFLGGGNITTFQRLVYAVLAVGFGLSLPPLKKFFDRLTNRLFYQDAYDAQVLLDQLNKVLVGNIDLEPLLRIAAELVGTTLKAEYCIFIIHETDETPRRVVGVRKPEFDDTEVVNLHIHRHIKDSQVVTDELEEVDVRIKEVLTKNNISIVSRLAATSGHKEEQGYLILGNKQSGNPYNKQDLQVLDIIANELVIAIQNAMRFEEIQTFNVTLQAKVNDATKQLRSTNEKLKALDETKDEFISMASHQLRTPLTSVKGYVSMVLDGDVGALKPKQEELLNQAFASSQRMVYLIADLLNVSRLRTGKFVIENKPTQLADVVETEMGQLTEMAKGKQQTLTYTKPKNFPELMLDETKIRQVIMNFADNALHYTQNGGHIQINLVDKGETIEYTVVDDGLGVPKVEQHHLFTKFFRAGNARKARPDGTGLGLFMAKKVIIAQGGAVIFSSEEGKGSTFGFTFSKAKLQKQPKTITKLASSAEEPKQPVDTLTPDTTPKPVAVEADKKPAKK